MRVSDDSVRALRERAQLLTEPAGQVVEVVGALAGIQAQSFPAARLAVRARSRGLTASDVDRALARRQAVRTWAMRGTLHVLLATDVRWMVGLLGPVFARAGQRRRTELGLDDRLCAAAMAALGDILAGEPLTRAEIVERLAAEKIVVEPRSQAPAHLLAYASHQGLICQGPPATGDEPTYTLLDDWLSGVRADEPADPQAELARRYLAGQAVATAADFATWSGLPIGSCRQAFESIRAELRPVGDAFAPAGIDLATVGERPARLLGAFDPYLLGYQGRALIVDPVHASRIQAGGGMITPSVLAGGRLVGSWKLDRSARRAAITVTPFARLPHEAKAQLAAEADDIGRFLGTVATLDVGEGGTP